MSWISAASLQRWNILIGFMFLATAVAVEHFGRTGSMFPAYTDCPNNLNHSGIDKLRAYIIFGILSFITALIALIHLVVPSLQNKSLCRLTWCCITFVFAMIAISIYTSDRVNFAACNTVVGSHIQKAENWTFAFQWTSFCMWFFACVWGVVARKDNIEDCGDCNVYM